MCKRYWKQNTKDNNEDTKDNKKEKTKDDNFYKRRNVLNKENLMLT